ATPTNDVMPSPVRTCRPQLTGSQRTPAEINGVISMSAFSLRTSELLESYLTARIRAVAFATGRQMRRSCPSSETDERVRRQWVDSAKVCAGAGPIELIAARHRCWRWSAIARRKE